jgi:hypothetical protein
MIVNPAALVAPRAMTQSVDAPQRSMWHALWAIQGPPHEPQGGPARDLRRPQYELLVLWLWVLTPDDE